MCHIDVNKNRENFRPPDHFSRKEHEKETSDLISTSHKIEENI